MHQNRDLSLVRELLLQNKSQKLPNLCFTSFPLQLTLLNPGCESCLPASPTLIGEAVQLLHPFKAGLQHLTSLDPAQEGLGCTGIHGETRAKPNSSEEAGEFSVFRSSRFPVQHPLCFPSHKIDVYLTSNCLTEIITHCKCSHLRMK